MDTNLPGHDEPEYLGDGPGGPAGDGPAPRRRTAVLAASGVAVLAVVAVGGWAVAQFISGGDGTASALPASTAAYLSVDLDPSAGQKIEAIRTLKKFPGIADHLDIGSRDDLRRYFFDQVQKESECKGFDYDQDVKPWIGERLAVAAVPDGDKAIPVVALQAGDEDAARKAVTKLDACGKSGDATGVAFVDGYLLVSDSQKHADSVAGQTAKGSLADDADFKTWMDRAGDPGVLTGYASADAPKLLKSIAEDQMSGDGPMAGMGGVVDAPQQVDKMLKLYKDFEGAAMVVRFGSGSLETEMVTKGLPQTVGGDKAPSVAGLPASTALAMSFGLHHGWLKGYLDSLNQMMGSGTSLDDAMKQGEAATGLKLPEDIETMLGDGVSLSVDSSIDLQGLTSSPDPSTVPLALRISGDPAKITPVIDKLKAMAGPEADLVTVKSGDGVVVVGLDKAYVDKVMSTGGLGSVRAFDDVVPHADQATGLLYIDFDAGDWATKLGDAISHNDPKVRANIAPLGALGISGWVDGDGVAHGLFRITTD